MFFAHICGRAVDFAPEARHDGSADRFAVCILLQAITYYYSYYYHYYDSIYTHFNRHTKPILDIIISNCAYIFLNRKKQKRNCIN